MKNEKEIAEAAKTIFYERPTDTPVDRVCLPIARGVYEKAFAQGQQDAIDNPPVGVYVLHVAPEQ
jgi:hypothetical protein